MDPIADMLTCIRNAAQALRPDLELKHSKIKESVARVLQEEGYLAECSVQGDTVKKLKIKLKYRGRKGVIEHLARASKPGLRRYVAAREIPRVLGGMGTAILTTSQGVMTGENARKKNIGGELVCFVW